MQRWRKWIQAAWQAALVLRDAVMGWVAHDCPSRSAALAFYALFSLAPMLLIIISVVTFIYGESAVTGELYGQLSSVIGSASAEVIQSAVARAWQAQHSWLAQGLAIGTIVIGASALFAQLRNALNHIMGLLPKGTVPLGMVAWSLLRARLLSFALVVGVGFIAIVSLLADAVLKFLRDWLWNEVSGLAAYAWAFRLLDYTVGVLVLALMFAMLIKWLPDQRPPWRPAFIGGLCGAVLFNIGKSAFGAYLARAGTQDLFGAAGSLAVLLMWLYYSSAIFLLCGEVTHRIAAGPPPPEPETP